MNKINNTLESIKDDIREELSNLKKEKSEKQKSNYNKLLKYKNKNGNLTSKEILIDYFNKIKQASKLNISHNSILSSKNNFDNNSLEISEISNFDMDEIKTDKNIHNINEKNINNFHNKTLEENKSQTNKIFNNYIVAKNAKITNNNENNIIYETFKNMLNKNKKNINTHIANTVSNLNNLKNINNNNDEECKLSTARFKTNESQINDKFINILEKEKIKEENYKIISEDNYPENNMKLNNDFNLVEFRKKEESNNIFKIVDKLEESGIHQIDNNEENINFTPLNNNFNYIETNPQRNDINIINFNTNNSNINNDNSSAHYNLSNNINISNINKETKSYIDSNMNISPTETNQNQIQNQFILNEIEPEQISIIKDLTNLKELNTNKSNNIKYPTSNTTPNNNPNNNNNLFTTSNISNNYNIKYNNNFYKTISHNNSKNNILYPQSVLSFSTKKSEHQSLKANMNKLNNSKKFEYYKKDFFVLKRKYNALKGKYSMEKKKAEGVNLKLYYESHKNDELIEQLKNKIKNLVEQIKSNVNTFDELKTQIDKKNKEIEQKSDIIVKQNEIIKGLINELKRRETNINFRSNNTFDSKSFNHESVSQSININEVNYDEENDKV